MKHQVFTFLFLLLASCSSADWLERLEARFGVGASVYALRAELEANGFSIVELTDFRMIQGGEITKNGQTINSWHIDEYLGYDCIVDTCSYLDAGRKDSFFGSLLTRRYFVYVAQEDNVIVAIDTISKPWRWFDFK